MPSTRRHDRINGIAIAAGAILMLYALVNTLLTTTGDYRSVLLTAVACATLAVPCLAVPLVRGPTGWRVAAAVCAAPALFIVSDFLRRAPHAFGSGS